MNRRMEIASPEWRVKNESEGVSPVPVVTLRRVGPGFGLSPSLEENDDGG